MLGSDIRAVLVRGSVFRAVRGIDPALRDADEGLDLAVAARLMGGRVALVPTTRVAVSGDGAAGLPFADTGRRRRMIIARRRAAQLHRRLTSAHPLLLVPIWLSLPFVALGRTIAQLVMKDPGRIAGEWTATILAMVRLAAIARGRRHLRRHRTVPWSRIAPLRVSTALARERA
ncbi:MAG TPA: glycosyl transferase, partial [Microbacterium sp.]|nr:glycosyl transferase [Microbacterium sp.]